MYQKEEEMVKIIDFKRDKLLDLVKDKLTEKISCTYRKEYDYKMVFTTNDNKNIEFFTVIASIDYDTPEGDVLNLQYGISRVVPSENPSDEKKYIDTFKIDALLPDDFTPEITAKAIVNTWLGNRCK